MRGFVERNLLEGGTACSCGPERCQPEQCCKRCLAPACSFVPKRQLASHRAGDRNFCRQGAGADHPTGPLWPPGLGHGERASAKYRAGAGSDSARICVAGHRGGAGAVRWQQLCHFRSQLKPGTPRRRRALLDGGTRWRPVGGNQRGARTLERRQRYRIHCSERAAGKHHSRIGRSWRDGVGLDGNGPGAAGRRQVYRRDGRRWTACRNHHPHWSRMEKANCGSPHSEARLRIGMAAGRVRG